MIREWWLIGRKPTEHEEPGACVINVGTPVLRRNENNKKILIMIKLLIREVSDLSLLLAFRFLLSSFVGALYRPPWLFLTGRTKRKIKRSLLLYIHVFQVSADPLPLVRKSEVRHKLKSTGNCVKLDYTSSFLSMSLLGARWHIS